MRAKNWVALGATMSALVAVAVSLPLAGAVPAGSAGGPTATTGVPTYDPVALATAAPVDPNLAKIREEGLKRSQVMDTLNYLSNVIGPRLTASPNLKRANEWTCEEMEKFGLENAHLESWNFGGRGWVVKRFEMQVIEPQQISLIAYPKAWSPGLEKPVVADVVLLDARTEADLAKYQGKLKGMIVLDGGVRNIGPDFTPLAVRLTDQDLQRLANVRPGADTDTQPPRGGAGGARAASGPASGPATGPATAPARGPGGRGFAGAGLQRGRIIQFLMQEGALMELSPSTSNELGMLVGQASEVLPTAPGAPAGRGGPSGYSLTAPESLPQVTVSAEGYNRLVRMSQLGVPLKIDTDLQVEYINGDPNCYNTIAEIPGSDLKDEVVMLGAHLDSWHMGTGATDNGTGVAECMEAVRIIKALGIQPRRTIRVGLWTGEEEGLLGSRAYVREHFGVNRNLTNNRGGRANGPGRNGAGDVGGAAGTEPVASAPGSQPATASGYLPAREKFSCYFNTDEGGGRFRGIYASSNAAAAAVLRQWMEPVKDLGISLISPGHATGSDHQAFEGVALPAFNFMPDPIDYWAGTWHTSQDVYDHVVPDDIKASSVIMASFVYQAAMADQKMPRTGP